MSEQNETQVAVVAPVVNVAALQKASSYDDTDFGGIAGSRAGFLPRLQLFTSNSEPVKKGEIGVAHYGIIKGKDTLIDLGKSVVVIPLAWRAKAMFVKSDPVLAYHNPKSEQFQEIKKKADADSNSGNMYGPEFLLWHEEHGYLTFFMGSKTARNEAPAIRALLPTPDGRLRAAVLSATYIQTKEYSWHGPKVVASSQSVTPPPADTLEVTISDFLNPTDSVVEKAPEDAARTDR